MNLNSFFTPHSVAVIGASADPNKVGYALMTNLKNSLSGHADRKVYPVSVTNAEVLGILAYKSVKDIPDLVDLAVIAVKADLVPGILNDCADKGINAAIIISAGFKEMGPDGAKLEEACGKIARDRGMAVLGPNCLGTIDADANFNSSFAAIEPLAGSIGFLSQSGALGTSLLDLAIREGVGFSKFISLGNEAHLTELEFLDYLAKDDTTKAILVYLEKLSNGPEFMRLAKEISTTKPIVVLKAGRSARGLRAVMSHTGSLAPEDSVFTAACKQSGVITVESIREFFNLAKLFQLGIYQPLQRFSIITNGGGPSVVTTDLVDSSTSLSLVEFSEQTKEALKKVLPPMAAVGNPVDMIGDALSNRYADTLEIVTAEKEADAILMLLTPQMMTEIDATARLVLEYRKIKPILPIFLGGPTVAGALKIFKENGIPNFGFPVDAVEALDDLAHGAAKKESAQSLTTSSDFGHAFSEARTLQVDAGRQRSTRSVPSPSTHDLSLSSNISGNAGIVQPILRMLNFNDTAKLLDEYSISLQGVFVKEKHDLVKAISKLRAGPFVMKAISPEVIHKTDAGAVRLHMNSLEEIQKAWDSILADVTKHVPGATVEGMLVQKMSAGKEVIIGMKRDAIFGPTILFGLGGIFTEALKDTSLRIAPLTKTDALDMISEIKGKSILLGLRGEKGVNIEALADLIVKVARLAVEHAEIKEIDLNPVMVTDELANVVDVRVMV
jgi:acetyltransferase